MKLIWPGIFLGTGAVGTAGGLYGNSLYLKSVSRQEANIKFEEIRSEIEAFVKDAVKDESVKENIFMILKDSWVNLLKPESKNDNFEELKRQIEEQTRNSLDKGKEGMLKNLYEKIEVFVKFLKDNGMDVSEYQNKISNTSVSQEEETLLKDD